MIAVFHLNAGSSGVEERMLREAVAGSRALTWAATPAHADVFVLTGPITAGIRPALLTLWRDYIAERAPLVALGRTSIDGHPFGRSGVTDIPELHVAVKIDGDPPTITAIQAGITQAFQVRSARH